MKASGIRMVLPVLFACLLSLLPAAGQKTDATPEEALQTTAAVFELFETKCNDCHGAHLAKPKGRFGYTMDLKRVAANEEWVTPGDPSKSELFRLVNEDEMPGKDSKQGNATGAEKLALRRWIQLGAPSALPEPLAAKQKTLLSGAAPKADEPGGPTGLGRLLAWVGRFHAASTHFPIGLLVAAILSEALGWWTRKDSWLTCTRFLVVLGAAGACNTAVLGWLNVHPGGAGLYQLHKWLGTGVAVWSLLCLGSALFFECREGTAARARLRGALFIGAVLVSVVGFLGGAIVYGLDHYNW